MLSTMLYTSCGNHRRSVDLGPAISVVTGCLLDNARCPDSIYLSTQEINVLGYDLNPWYSCMQREEAIGSTDFYVDDNVVTSSPSTISNRPVHSYNHSNDWKPPYLSRKGVMYVSYSQVFNSQSQALVFLTTYSSGREIGVSACLFRSDGLSYVFDNCYCRMNPY